MKDGLNFSVELDRMHDELSSIWIKVGGKGRKSLLLGGIYREHFLIRQSEPNSSRDKQQQELRWKKFINQWKAASSTGQCIVIGDLNLDLHKWDEPDSFHEKIIDMMKNDICSRNISQVIHGPTRFWPGTTLLYRPLGLVIMT